MMQRMVVMKLLVILLCLCVCVCVSLYLWCACASQCACLSERSTHKQHPHAVVLSRSIRPNENAVRGFFFFFLPSAR